MINVTKEGVVLRKTGLDFENEAVLNPAVIQAGGSVHMFYRAVHIKNYSTIGYCRLDGPLTVAERRETPILFHTYDYEKHGLEDPRIVKIDDTYYLTYIAFDGDNALGVLATSTDLQHFKKHGIIVPKIALSDLDRLTESNPEINKRYLQYNPGANILADKDVVFFPRRINGKLTFLHRIKPDIQVAAVDSLNELTPAFWEEYFANFGNHIFLEPRFPHEISYIGGGCPPIESKEGWLIIYHGVKTTDKGGYEYSCCVALVDLEDPFTEIARLPYPLFKPELDYELSGDVANVCFPTGTAVIEDTLYIYYGAADELIACASVSLSALIAELLQNTVRS